MKRFKITLLIPHSKEIVVETMQEAHNEASRLAAARAAPGPKAIVHSVEEVGFVTTEPIDFDPDGILDKV